MRNVLVLLMILCLTGCGQDIVPIFTSFEPRESSVGPTDGALPLHPIPPDKNAAMEASLDVYYDPTESKTFQYIVFVKNNDMRNAVIDISIVERDKILKEHTIGVNSFKRESSRGTIVFDTVGLHNFEIKINKITYSTN